MSPPNSMPHLPDADSNLLHASVCQALADPKRILILYALAERPRQVNNLAQDLNLAQPTVSRHLRILHNKSLVDTEREGINITYRLADRRVIEVLNTLRLILFESLERKTAVLPPFPTGDKQPGKRPFTHVIAQDRNHD